MKRVIAVSFKNTKKELELYNLLQQKTDKSAFIKDTLREALTKEERVITKVKVKKTKPKEIEF